MHGELFTPKSHFFKLKGNTFQMPDGLSDYLEDKLYSPLDSNVANIFKKIKSSVGMPKYNLTDKEIVQLEYFFGHLYWRNPSGDEHVKQLLKIVSLKDLGIVDKGGKEGQEKAERVLKSHPDFFKIIKAMIPLIIFRNYKEVLNHKYMILDYKNGLPGLLGDNPVIIKEKAHNNFIEDMVVPLTKELVFIRNKKTIKALSQENRLLIDMMLLKQANEYVCVTDKIYIEQLEDKYNSHYIKGDLENLRRLLFYGLEKDADI